LEYLNERDHQENFSAGNVLGEFLLDLSGLAQGPNGDCCKHGKKHMGSIKY
jgi:hypothetical protein